MNIFITGGTSGMGLDLAQVYLEKGDRVGVCGRDLSKIPTKFREKYPQLECFQVDVTDSNELDMAIKTFSHSGLDMMIANAGIGVGSKSKLPDLERGKTVINVNVMGVLNAFQSALEIMEIQKKGHLVAVASVAGMVGLPRVSTYSASKAAVLKLCEGLAIDLKPFNIDVTAIAPGYVDTPLTQTNKHSMPFLMSSPDAAKVISKAIAKKKTLFIFPLPMKIIMTILERIPRKIYSFFMSKIYVNGTFKSEN